ncbi:MAG: PQQ-binding-like beta-propeller repeat protein, partial [Planctomycetota bacterium]|nr:PQQ-binding-like beta-propeller repeat protein [Planctomycetota bacterium]
MALVSAAALGFAWAGSAHAGAAAPSAEWPNYRGPANDGISADKTLQVAAVKDGLQPVWKASVGEGYSGITVAGGKIFTMGNDGTNDTVWCLDANTGQVVWKHTYACGTDGH